MLLEGAYSLQWGEATLDNGTYNRRKAGIPINGGISFLGAAQWAYEILAK